MSLPRYRKPPLRSVGEGTMRKASQRQLAYRAVTIRAKGRCELCPRLQDPLDAHHAFGRGHLPGIPSSICETPELILGVCRPCHDAIHAGDLQLAGRARWLATERFAFRWNLHLGGAWREGEQLQIMRLLVRQFEAAH